MKTNSTLCSKVSVHGSAVLKASALAGLLWSASVAMIQSSEQLEVELKAAMHLELVDGDLQGAITDYRSILARAGKNRAIASKALLQMGKCYERLGAEEAKKAYEHLLRDYSDQKEVAAEARSRLKAMQAVFDQKSRGPTIRQVWSGPGTDRSGAPSPDGKYLSFVDWSTSDLAIRDLETGENRRLTEHPPEPYEYAWSSIWSPDGKQLAYQWCEREGRPVELFVIGLDGSKPRLLHSKKNEWIEPYDWSPDGRHILARIGGRKNQIALISAADGSVRVVKTLVRPAGGACFSPDGRYIVYAIPQTEDSLDRDIHVMSLEDASDRLLVSHAADDSILGWTPNGKFILFLSDRTGSPCFWLLPVADGKPEGSPQMIRAASRRTVPLGFTRDGRFFYGESKGGSDVYTVKLESGTGKVLGLPEKLVERYEGFNYWPNYSTDGKHLAYCSQRDDTGYDRGGNALCILSLETGKTVDFFREVRRLGFEHMNRPHWSPDDQSIVVYGYTIDDGVWGSIYRINIKTGNVIPIVQGGGDFDVAPAISNGANDLLYLRRDKRNNRYQIVTRNYVSASEKVIYTFPESENPHVPELSPDGRWLCYLSHKVFYIMTPSGGEPRRIFEITGQGDRPNRFTWAADSKHILFTREEEGLGWQLWRLPIDGGNPEVLGLGLESHISCLSAHPDGQRVAYSHSRGDVDIWVMEDFLPGNEATKKQREQ